MCIRDSFKADVPDHVEYLKRQIAKNQVDLHLNTEITLEDVKKINPDFVVFATGANPVVIPVPGADKPNVSTAVPVLLKQKAVGQKDVYKRQPLYYVTQHMLPAIGYVATAQSFRIHLLE